MSALSRIGSAGWLSEEYWLWRVDRAIEMSRRSDVGIAGERDWLQTLRTTVELLDISAL